MPLPTVYKRHSLGELIEALRDLPGDTEVYGLTEEIFSYRGYYERPCIAPSREEETHTARHLVETYSRQIGKEITGWKGGDYEVNPRELVYVASRGDTGPSIIGLRKNPFNDLYGPVLLAEDWHF